ncbi:sugar transferase [Sphingobium mellinum]|uniref:sugar transferase n=1 Tax=Sphingobium mellinum TaxID=1387166 RepID=UPI0030EE8C5A
MNLRTIVEQAAAGLLLVLLAPLLLAVAIAIGLTMGSPILFSQVRSGLDRRLFTLWKFRTMIDVRDGKGQPLPDEHRTTRLGAFLRRTRIDELPELWHILTGQMSFIGPRPLLPPTIAGMGQDGVHRCSVRPGLTGWAQIHGGPLLTLNEKLDMDLWYIRSASLKLDALILWRTILVVLLGDHRSFNPSAAGSGERRQAQPASARDDQPTVDGPASPMVDALVANDHSLPDHDPPRHMGSGCR